MFNKFSSKEAQDVEREILTRPESQVKVFSPIDASLLNSYVSLAGFPTDTEVQTDPRDDIDPKVFEKIEKNVNVRSIIEEVTTNNNQLFIRPCTLTCTDHVKVFGKAVARTSEVLSDKGTRIMLIGRTYYWKPYLNWVEPPTNTELERFDFFNENGFHIFRCSLYNNRMTMFVGADCHFGEFVLEDYVSSNCEEIDFGYMTIEDSNAQQVYRFEKSKRHFDVLLYPEQLKISFIYNMWDPKQFSFVKTMKNRIFGCPLPDDMSPRRRALLFVSSFYLYEKYYQKDRRCRYILGIFIVFSTIIIVGCIVIQKLHIFEDK